MPLHPLAARLLQKMSTSQMPSFDKMSVAEARQAFAIVEALGGEGPRVRDIIQLSVPVGNTSIPMRLYVPDGDAPFPTVLWCHGGGWVMGNLAVADAYCRWLCTEAKCAVLSVDFRLAPESAYPAQVEDCYAAANYLASNATSMGLDRERFAIAGDSTGANLAVATAMMARERGRVSFKSQILFFPVLDPSTKAPSYSEFAEGYLFTAEAFRWFWAQYAPDETTRRQPHVDLFNHGDLKDLPSTLVVTAEYDPVRDEGEAFVTKLQEAGIKATLQRYDGMIHGFLGLENMFEAAQDAYRQAAVALNESWGRS